MDYKKVFESKYNRELWQQLLHDIFLSKAEFYDKPKEVSVTNQLAKQALYLGKIKLSSSEIIAVYEVELSDKVDIVRNRRGIRDLLASDWRNNGYVGAFVLSYRKNESILRFSYVSETWNFNDEGEYRKTSTDTKRYTYLFGEGHPCRTAIQQFEKLRSSNLTLTDITSAFSVEALSKEFYRRLFQWYEWAASEDIGITFPNDPNTTEDDREDLNIKIIRLITRLLFVWFIKQKNLVPDKLFSASYLKTILKDFDKDSVTDGCFYNAILQNLFFATLNCAIVDDEGNKRSFASTKYVRDTKNQYRYAEMFNINEEEIIELFSKIPFLNGGLFECLDKPKDLYKDLDHDILYDGFSRNAARATNGNYKYRAFVPNNLFFSEDEQQPGLITLLNEYNFTIEENSTNDAVISLDPELLGQVFENLLAAYNPETQDSARKATGSFYTPRVIVDYMVDEAIIAYLKGQETGGVKEDDLRYLFNNREKNANWNDDQSSKVTEALKSVKILDPACGSGAFPMGCLLRIVEIIEALNDYNINRYELKLGIIENCVYGADIQSIAMLICKLRFFISLICDQENIDFDKPEDNFGINTLPNLETKFVAANSLISADIRNYDNNWTNDKALIDLKEQLLDIRNKHFLAKERSTKRKCQRDDENKRKEICDYIISISSKPDEEKIRLNKEQLALQLAELEKYKEEVWQDISSNELELFDNKSTLFSIDVNKEKRDKIKQRIKNIENVIRTEKNKSVLTGYEAAISQITNWNPYNQNSVSPFFDPEWMFCIDTKFDIVIGNPPYIQLQNNGGELAALYENCGYQSFARTGDIYCLFYERGYQLLKPNGHLCFITSNKWMRAGYGEKMRSFLTENTNPKLLIDFAGVKIFESATVDTNILLFSKSANEYKTLCAVPNKKNEIGLFNLSLFVQQHGALCGYRGSESWVILSPIEQSIKKKIEAVGTPLKDWNIQIYRGVLTGYNDAFIVSTEKREEILANCKSEEERKRTAELIRPILRGRDIKRYSYDWAELWLIATFPSRHYNIDQYPSVKRYLLSYGMERLEQTGKTHIVNGEKIKARKKTSNKWFETQDSISYWKDFDKPKIVYMEIQTDNPKDGYPFPCFSFDKGGAIVLNTAYIMCSDTIDVRYILGILNSSLGAFFSKLYVTQLQQRQFRMLAQYVCNFPIVQSSIQQQRNLVEYVENRLSSYSTEAEEKINKLVFDMYGLNEEECNCIKNNEG